MEERYFPYLLDPKGVSLQRLLEFVADIVYGDECSKILLARAVDDFNLYSNGNESDRSMRFNKGSVIQLTTWSDTEGKWEGSCYDSTGDLNVGTFPASLVKKMSPKEWSCRNLVDFLINPKIASTNSKIGTTFSKKFLKEKRSRKTPGEGVSSHFLVTHDDDCFYDVVQSLASHFKGQDFSKIVIWIDVLCVNHQMMKRLMDKSSYTSKSSKLRTKVSEKHLLQLYLIRKLPRLIGMFDDMLVFFNRFDKPRNLFSFPSIWAMFCACQTKKKVEVILTRRQRKKANHLFFNDFKETVKKLPELKLANIHDPIRNRKISSIIKMYLSDTSGAMSFNQVQRKITKSVLKPFLAHLVVSMWYEKKKKCEESNKGLLKVAVLSNLIGLQIYSDLRWIDLSKLMLLYSAKCYAKSLGVHHKFVALAFFNLGLMQIEAGASEKAVKYLTRAINIFNKHRSEHEEDIVVGLNILSELYSKLEMADFEGEIDSEKTERTFHDMLVETKRFSSSHELLKSSLRKSSGPKQSSVLNSSSNSLFLATGFNNLAEFLKKESRLDEAEVLLKESLRILRICTEIQPLSHESFRLIPTVYNNLGVVLEMNGKSSSKSFECFSKALYLLRRCEESTSGEAKTKAESAVDMSLANLATFLTVSGREFERRNEAREMVSKAIKNRTGVSGSSEIVDYKQLKQVGALIAAGKESPKLKEQVEKLTERLLGADHFRTQKARAL